MYHLRVNVNELPTLLLSLILADFSTVAASCQFRSIPVLRQTRVRNASIYFTTPAWPNYLTVLVTTEGRLMFLRASIHALRDRFLMAQRGIFIIKVRWETMTSSRNESRFTVTCTESTNVFSVLVQAPLSPNLNSTRCWDVGEHAFDAFLIVRLLISNSDSPYPVIRARYLTGEKSGQTTETNHFVPVSLPPWSCRLISRNASLILWKLLPVIRLASCCDS